MRGVAVSSVMPTKDRPPEASPQHDSRSTARVQLLGTTPSLTRIPVFDEERRARRVSLGPTCHVEKRIGSRPFAAVRGRPGRALPLRQICNGSRRNGPRAAGHASDASPCVVELVPMLPYGGPSVVSARRIPIPTLSDRGRDRPECAGLPAR